MAAWVLLCALLLRSLLPPGYMPDLGALADGRLPLVICTGTGPQAFVLLDDAGKPVKTTDLPAPSDVPCLFALLAALPAPVLVALTAFLLFWSHGPVLWRRVRDWSLRPSYLRLPGDTPPRAPPAFI